MYLLESIGTALIDWSRAQFALTACYHWLFVPLTLGLALIMALMETQYVRTGEAFWKDTARFWQKLFGINFAVGVATGLILEFEFGTNWSNYSWFVGDIFGAPLAIEGIVAFFMESTFIGVMFFGWDKVGRGFHLASTWLTGIGATLSAWWILVANSWMQHPVGMELNPLTARSEMTDFFAVAFAPEAAMKFLHTVSSCWLTGAVFVVAVSSWFLLRGRNGRTALASMRIAAVTGLVSGLIVMGTGDQSGVSIAKEQPMKLAAAEGLRQGGQQAPFSIVPGIEVPGMLSMLATHDFNGYVPGIDNLLDGYTAPDGTVHLSAEEKMQRGKQAVQAFSKLRAMQGDSLATPEEQAVANKEYKENLPYFGYGFIGDRAQLVPPVWIVYWSFRIMVGTGMVLMLLFVLVAWFSRKKGNLAARRWLLHAGMWCLPLAYLGGQAGWIVAEVGRQPWAIQDLLPVNAAISSLSPQAVQTTFFIFLALFTALLFVELRIMLKAIREHKAE